MLGSCHHQKNTNLAKARGATPRVFASSPTDLFGSWKAWRFDRGTRRTEKENAMNGKCLPAILLVGISVSACTQHAPYRTPRLAVESRPCIAEPDQRHQRPIAECVVDRDCDPTSAKPRAKVSPALQHRHYEATWKDGTAQPGDYYLSFVEFDDQGWFADREQMEALFALLAELEQKKTEALIYVYAHGWKHNASACDSNVVCFSRLLERTDLAEQGLRQENRRQVVGVYLGWRGLPFTAGPLTNVSFWTRKEAAARVGRGGVFELLVRLRDYRNSRQASDTEAVDTDPDKTQLVITGHSFGGLVIYSALSHALMEGAAKATYPDGVARHEPAKSFGDFVMLVNPAFEGSLYEPLFRIATDPDRSYDAEKQRPVMMIVTSEADSATGKAFPMGRTLGTLFQHATTPGPQKKSMRQAIGHDDRYLTHRLQIKEGVHPEPDRKPAKAESECGCPFLDRSKVWDPAEITRIIQALLEAAGLGEGGGDRAGEQGLKGELSYGAEVDLAPRCELKSARSYPYLVVRTGGPIIPNHNAIYSERFIDFSQLFLLYHIAGLHSLPLPGGPEGLCWDGTAMRKKVAEKTR